MVGPSCSGNLLPDGYMDGSVDAGLDGGGGYCTNAGGPVPDDRLDMDYVYQCAPYARCLRLRNTNLWTCCTLIDPDCIQ